MTACVRGARGGNRMERGARSFWEEPMRRFWILALSVALACVAGCGDGPRQAHVSGAVSIDGEPVKLGVIQFVPTEGKTPTSGAEIREGSYATEIFIGPAEVRISYPKVTGKKKPYEGPDVRWLDLTTEMIPEKFNRSSTLRAEVKSGDNVLDFHLKSTD
jgi:hypothetical protein